jgi:SagB-type dehydrogenase family enzyme
LLTLPLPIGACNTDTNVEPPPRLSPIEVIALPAAQTDGAVSLEATLQRRRSIRMYTDKLLTDEQLGQLMWAAQGKTRDWGGRTAPSAGALYPIELFAVTSNGVMHYVPDQHRAEVLSREDVRAQLAPGKLAPPAIFVIAAVYLRTEAKYAERAERYVKLEAGHVAQNILLQAVALKLGAVPIGSFDDAHVAKVLELPVGYAPVYLLSVGYAAE